MSHTPGPWTIREYPDKIEIVADFPSDGKCLAGEILVATVEDIWPENAPLVAAAPEAYALAKHIETMADDAYLIGHPEWIEIADEALAFIAKAEGGEGGS